MGIIIRKQLLLLVDSCRRLDLVLWSSYNRYIPGSPTVTSFTEPFDAVVMTRLDILLICSAVWIRTQWVKIAAEGLRQVESARVVVEEKSLGFPAPWFFFFCS